MCPRQEKAGVTYESRGIRQVDLSDLAAAVEKFGKEKNRFG